MISFARIFAIAGVILLGMGTVVPVHRAANVDDISCSAPTIQQSFIAIECLQDDVEIGFQASIFGFVMIGIAIFGLLVSLRPRVGRIWTLAFTVTALVVVLYLYFTSLNEFNAAGDLDWGWGVLAGSVVSLLLAAFVALLRPQPAL